MYIIYHAEQSLQWSYFNLWLTIWGRLKIHGDKKYNDRAFWLFLDLYTKELSQVKNKNENQRRKTIIEAF